MLYAHLCTVTPVCLELYVIMLHLLYHFYFFNCFGTFLCRGCVFLIALALPFLVSKTFEGEACERIRNPDHTEKSKKDIYIWSKIDHFQSWQTLQHLPVCAKKCLLLCVRFFLLQERPREADVQTIQRKVRKMCHTWHLMSNIWTPFFSCFYSFYVRR